MAVILPWEKPIRKYGEYLAKAFFSPQSILKYGSRNIINVEYLPSFAIRKTIGKQH
jgi:hypothetical protein